MQAIGMLKSSARRGPIRLVRRRRAASLTTRWQDVLAGSTSTKRQSGDRRRIGRACSSRIAQSRDKLGATTGVLRRYRGRGARGDLAPEDDLACLLLIKETDERGGGKIGSGR